MVAPDTPPSRPCQRPGCDDYDPRALGWCARCHPFSPEMLRGTRTTDGLLFRWGIDVRFGYWRAALPADPDRPRIGKAFGPRDPAVMAHLLLCEAFGRLAEETAGLGRDGELAWTLHLPLNRHQEVVYLYYVQGYGWAGRGKERERSPEEAAYLLRGMDANPVVYRGEVVTTVDEPAYGDRAVAAELARLGRGVDRSTVTRWRDTAIKRMARSCGWPGD